MEGLRARREAKGLTQEQLASRAGVALRTLQRAERGGKPTVAVLQKLASALDVNVADLLEPAA
jgi:transcriptional regulator with XRE-family HTH domain